MAISTTTIAFHNSKYTPDVHARVRMISVKMPSTPRDVVCNNSFQLGASGMRRVRSDIGGILCKLLELLAGASGAHEDRSADSNGFLTSIVSPEGDISSPSGSDRSADSNGFLTSSVSPEGAISTQL